jgi:hypothetical protein
MKASVDMSCTPRPGLVPDKLKKKQRLRAADVLDQAAGGLLLSYSKDVMPIAHIEIGEMPLSMPA